jgi:hypothetical protein
MEVPAARALDILLLVSCENKQCFALIFPTCFDPLPSHRREAKGPNPRAVVFGAGAY